MTCGISVAAGDKVWWKKRKKERVSKQQKRQTGRDRGQSKKSLTRISHKRKCIVDIMSGEKLLSLSKLSLSHGLHNLSG